MPLRSVGFDNDEFMQRPAIGAPAPAIDLPTADGGRWRLADQVGHSVVLVFHRHIH